MVQAKRISIVICFAIGVVVASVKLTDVIYAAPLAEVYVALPLSPTSCSDTNEGSPAKPVCTITKAVSMIPAGSGGTITVRAGTYPSFQVSRSGIQSQPLIIKTYPGEKVIIDAKKTAYGIQLKNTRYVVIDGFEVMNAAGEWSAGVVIRGSDVKGTDYTKTNSSHNTLKNLTVHDNYVTNTTNNWVSGILVTNSSYNLIENCISYRNYITGISIEANTDVTVFGNQVIGNTVYDNDATLFLASASSDNSDGIQFAGNRNTAGIIRNNKSYRNGDDGIDTWTSSGHSIENNIAYNNQGGTKGAGDGNGFKLGGRAIGGNHSVQFNVAYGNKSIGFDANGSGGTTFLHNVAFNNGTGFDDSWRDITTPQVGCPDTARCKNTFYNNIGYNNLTANFSASKYTAASDYNNWFSDGKGVFSKYESSPPFSLFDQLRSRNLDTNSLSVNPGFVNTAGANFTLIQTSPLIDKAYPSSKAAVQACGNAPDIGVYEYCPIQPTGSFTMVTIRAFGTIASNDYARLVVLIKGQKVIDSKVTGTLKDYSYSYPGTVNPADVRIEFYDDLAHIVNGKLEDRNIFIDYMKLNSTLYQAEDPSVFTSGAWTFTTGCTAGNKGTEWLDCPGAYMTFQ